MLCGGLAVLSTVTLERGINLPVSSLAFWPKCISQRRDIRGGVQEAPNGASDAALVALVGVQQRESFQRCQVTRRNVHQNQYPAMPAAVPVGFGTLAPGAAPALCYLSSNARNPPFLPLRSGGAMSLHIADAPRRAVVCSTMRLTRWGRPASLLLAGQSRQTPRPAQDRTFRSNSRVKWKALHLESDQIVTLALLSDSGHTNACAGLQRTYLYGEAHRQSVFPAN
jgi:hypothetical protein